MCVSLSFVVRSYRFWTTTDGCFTTNGLVVISVSYLLSSFMFWCLANTEGGNSGLLSKQSII